MNQNRQAPIGVFDSGVGGLTVAREIMRNLPSERIVYFGDTARVPYGSKSKEIVLKFSRQIVRFLQLQDVKAIVVACNTASALALEEIKKEIDITDIEKYKCKKARRTALYKFNLYINGKKVLICTRYKEEFENILKDNNVQNVVR